MEMPLSQRIDPARVDVPMAFDHGDIVADYLHWRQDGVLPKPR